MKTLTVYVGIKDTVTRNCLVEGYSPNLTKILVHFTLVGWCLNPFQTETENVEFK